MNSSSIANSSSVDAQDKSMPPLEPSLLGDWRELISVTKVLRAFGAAAVIVSMSLFMLQGWSEGNDITRYLKLLGQTGLLTGIGLLLTFVVKEVKGARVFFGLSLLSVVANFTILGALTFSMTQWDLGLVEYPAMMKWEVIDPSTFFMVFAGAFLLLAVVSHFSFSIFSRNTAGTLTMSFLAMCGLLLIPVRSSMLVCLIAGASIWAAITIIHRLRNNSKVVLTGEAKGAMNLLYLPGLIMVARAVSLYKIDHVMLICLGSFAYFTIRSLLSRAEKSSVRSCMLEIALFGVGVFLSFNLIDLLPYEFYAYTPVIFAGLLGGFLLDQLTLSKEQGLAALNLNFTAFALVFSYLWFSIFNSHIEWQLSSLFASGMILFICWLARKRVNNRQIANISGRIGVVASVFMLGTRIVELVNLSNWMLIGLAGVLLIVGASLYERYGFSFLIGKTASQ